MRSSHRGGRPLRRHSAPGPSVPLRVGGVRRTESRAAGAVRRTGSCALPGRRRRSRTRHRSRSAGRRSRRWQLTSRYPCGEATAVPRHSRSAAPPQIEPRPGRACTRRFARAPGAALRVAPEPRLAHDPGAPSSVSEQNPPRCQSRIRPKQLPLSKRGMQHQSIDAPVETRAQP